MKDKEVLQSVGLLWAAAQNKKGRGFSPAQINHIARYLNVLSVKLMQCDQQIVELKETIQAYTDEHSKELP
jgi:flagellar biosynthesis chaperone FliJ